MTKGYRGVKGEILERTQSQFDFFVLKLENRIHLVAGPTAVEVVETKERSKN
ncbi:MAG: hypothetical protein WB818_02275 [Desulfobacterales bacterium]|jgi:hypothetical protein